MGWGRKEHMFAHDEAKRYVQSHEEYVILNISLNKHQSITNHHMCYVCGYNNDFSDFSSCLKWARSWFLLIYYKTNSVSLIIPKRRATSCSIYTYESQCSIYQSWLLFDNTRLKHLVIFSGVDNHQQLLFLPTLLSS